MADNTVNSVKIGYTLSCVETRQHIERKSRVPVCMVERGENSRGANVQISLGVGAVCMPQASQGFLSRANPV